MPDDLQIGEVIETTVGEVAAELTRRGLDPHDHVTITISPPASRTTISTA